MYRVTKYFIDLQDNNHPYHAGDIYPRSGVVVSEDRFAELAGSENKQGVPLIQLVEEVKPKKATTKRAKKTAE